MPDMMVAVAMRRCYSTKTIEEIESELEQKGPTYWKYLLSKALQDKSLDVFEHFTMSLALDGASETEVGELARAFPYMRASRIGADSWLVSLNARTLVELLKDQRSRRFAVLVVTELEANRVCPVLSELAFGGKFDES
jgi:hypothetical protein